MARRQNPLQYLQEIRLEQAKITVKTQAISLSPKLRMVYGYPDTSSCLLFKRTKFRDA